MRLDPTALVELARWNHRQERAQAEYRAMPTATGHVDTVTRKCRVCGKRTYAAGGVHRRCEG